MLLPIILPGLAGLAMKNDIGDTLRDHIRKYTPYLRLPEFNLAKAADYLEHWVDGILPMTPLLDVSACLVCIQCESTPLPCVAFLYQHLTRSCQLFSNILASKVKFVPQPQQGEHMAGLVC